MNKASIERVRQIMLILPLNMKGESCYQITSIKSLLSTIPPHELGCVFSTLGGCIRK